MRFARALLASFGASTCLVLAGTLAMASLSAVVAFRGLPGLDAVRSQEQTVAVLSAASSGAGDAAQAADAPVSLVPVRRATGGPSLASIVRRAQGQLAAPTRLPAATQGLNSSVTTIRPGLVQVRPSATATATPPVVPASPATPPASGSLPLRGEGATEPVRKAGRDLGGAVATTGDALGDVVTPVAPALAPTVADATNTVGGVVVGTTEIVAGVVDGVVGVVIAP